MKRQKHIHSSSIARAALALICAPLLISCALFSSLPKAGAPTDAPARDTPVPAATVVDSASKTTSEAPQPAPTRARQPTRTPWITATQVPSPTTVPPTEDPNRYVSPVDGMPLVFVPEGEFLMGSDEGAYEHPARKYWLDAFWIDQTEVTVAMYMQCFKAGACQHPKNLPDVVLNDPSFQPRPVTNVFFTDARDYCTWTGRRLPTSAEWEKAARGTDGRQFPWGNQPFDRSLCNGGHDPSGGADAKAVGSYPEGASPYGALDMCGNVVEIVADYYGYYWEMNEPYKNPTGPSTGTMRVTRGGGFDFIQDSDYTTWGRNWLADGSLSNEAGFRCAISDKDLKK